MLKFNYMLEFSLCWLTAEKKQFNIQLSLKTMVHLDIKLQRKRQQKARLLQWARHDAEHLADAHVSSALCYIAEARERPLLPFRCLYAGCYLLFTNRSFHE